MGEIPEDIDVAVFVPVEVRLDEPVLEDEETLPVVSDVVDERVLVRLLLELDIEDVVVPGLTLAVLVAELLVDSVELRLVDEPVPDEVADDWLAELSVVDDPVVLVVVDDALELLVVLDSVDVVLKPLLMLLPDEVELPEVVADVEELSVVDAVVVVVVVDELSIVVLEELLVLEHEVYCVMVIDGIVVK